MNRIACLLVSAFLLSGGAAFAQGEMDAYRYSQTDLNGTARYLSMGGAFGALGGDISAMSANPAGLGIYRSSEVVTTLSLSSIKTNSDWNGSKIDTKNTKFNFDNIAYVGYFPTGNDEGLVGWNVGFSYNRVKNFNRNYSLAGNQAFSLGDYAAVYASNAILSNSSLLGIPEDDLVPLLSNNESERRLAYNSLGGLWLPALAYQSGLIGTDVKGGRQYHSTFAEPNEQGGWYPDSRPDDVLLEVRERGAIDKYDFSFATNISNRVFLGATIAITDLRYRMSSEYSEWYYYTDNTTDHLFWDNQKATDGTGYSFNLGAIVRANDNLRFGVAYNSPTWYNMTDSYYASAQTHNGGDIDSPTMDGETPTNPNPYTDYRLRSADKWIFSAAGIIGQTALISVDYELSNYKHMSLSDRDGYEYPDNDLFKEHFGLAHTFKAGAEVKVTPQFAVRAGFNWKSSPFQKEVRDGNLEIFPSGTSVNYTLDKGTTAYTVGLGYRFTPNFYMDLACVYRQYKEDAYTFSNIIIDGEKVVSSDAIGLKTNTTQVALTLGYKF